MSYNLSSNKFKRWSLFLDTIAKNPECKIPSSTPDKLAYNIREAIAAARHHKIPPWTELTVRIEVRPGHIICRHKQDLDVTVPLPSIQDALEFQSPANEFDVVQAVNDNAEYANFIFHEFTGNPDPVIAWAKQLQIYKVVRKGSILLVSRK